jgi:hypothetical protein
MPLGCLSLTQDTPKPQIPARSKPLTGVGGFGLRSNQFLEEVSMTGSEFVSQSTERTTSHSSPENLSQQHLTNQVITLMRDSSFQFPEQSTHSSNPAVAAMLGGFQLTDSQAGSGKAGQGPAEVVAGDQQSGSAINSLVSLGQLWNQLDGTSAPAPSDSSAAQSSSSNQSSADYALYSDQSQIYA